MSLTLDEYISDDSGSVQENGEVTEEQVEWQHIGQILPDKVRSSFKNSDCGF